MANETAQGRKRKNIKGRLKLNLQQKCWCVRRDGQRHVTSVVPALFLLVIDNIAASPTADLRN